MTGTTRLTEPSACAESERREFARLVRQGFPGAEDLERRIRQARWLAFHHAADATLAAVAALKAPTARYREDVFRRAGALGDSTRCEAELGWVFVSPAYRGSGVAEALCRALLAHLPESGVFATTRPDNGPMIRILLALHFARVGEPYAWRGERLVLFLRPPRTVVDGHPPAEPGAP